MDRISVTVARLLVNARQCGESEPKSGCPNYKAKCNCGCLTNAPSCNLYDTTGAICGAAPISGCQKHARASECTNPVIHVETIHCTGPEDCYKYTKNVGPVGLVSGGYKGYCGGNAQCASNDKLRNIPHEHMDPYENLAVCQILKEQGVGCGDPCTKKT